MHPPEGGSPRGTSATVILARPNQKAKIPPSAPLVTTLGARALRVGASQSRKAILAMFQISRLEDANVKILPENLGKPRLEAITQEIESLYIDKVIKDLGLVITLYEIVSIEGGTVCLAREARTSRWSFAWLSSVRSSARS